MSQNYRIRPIVQEETLTPEVPTDAVGQYAALLLRWEDLTRQQAKYEDELAKLGAQGDKLSAEWETLRQDRAACVDALAAAGVAPHEAIEGAWTFFKVHLFVLCQQDRRSGGMSQSIPTPITTLAAPLARNPRATA
jgi:hypothetical protein